MEQNTTIDKSLQWYFHQNEIVRMLRYFQLNTCFNNDVDYSVNYSNNPSIGVVIGTYGCVPYVDLQLHFLKNINKIDKILIHDDCSNKQDELKQLANKYNVDFYSTSKRLWHKTCIGSIGDTNTFLAGLRWAKENNLEILVKLSRRLIPCFEWKTKLQELAKSTNSSTFGSYCTKDPFNLRTECIGLNVNVWNDRYPIYNLDWTIQNEYPIFAEFWMHELAKTLSGNNYNEKWLNYVKNSKNGYLHSGYAIWKDILGTSRYTDENKTGKVLWHMYSDYNKYFEVSKELFGNKYFVSDFKDCENF